MRTFSNISLLISVLLLFSTQLLAQSGNPTTNEFTAVLADQAPRIDGNLDDDIWKTIEPITQFTQVWPSDGSPATEQTEVRIAYDQNNLYFALKFYDKNPELIRAKNLERGGRNDRDDHAVIALDTYMDGRNAYLFEMNALGTQDDATITDETITTTSFSWDAVFLSETIIDDEGWSMEVSIPFRQLRFPEGDEIEFGLMISRVINRKNERVIWPAIGLEFGNFTAMAAVSQYGTLKGIKNVRRGKNLEIKPYITTGVQEVREDLAFEATEVKEELDLGMDVKYGLTSNLTLDMTVNTDFAQVEADNVQLNLGRFSLFFPEKREFFLERSGLFEHGNLRSTQTFFSRKIGLENEILAGTRMTGQVGNVSVGALNIETGEKMGDFFGSNSQNNSVIRLRSNVLPRATAGAIFTNLESEDSYNRALGIDTQYRFGSSSSFNAWLTNVWDDEEALNDAAGHVSVRLKNDMYLGQFSYTNVGRNYSPELGFVRRANMRNYYSRFGFTPTVDIESMPSINRLNFFGLFSYIEGQDGVKQTTNLEFETEIIFRRRDRVAFEFDQRFERLDKPFGIRPGIVIPVGEFNFFGMSISGETDSSRRFFANSRLSASGFYTGKRLDIRGGFGFRQSQHLTLEGRINHSKIDLDIPNGEFEATTASLSILGAFNRKLFTRTLIQYDNFSRDLQANIRVNWIHTPGSDLFLVYNTSYLLTGDNDNIFDPRKNLVMRNQVAIVKLTYLILL